MPPNPCALLTPCVTQCSHSHGQRLDNAEVFVTGEGFCYNAFMFVKAEANKNPGNGQEPLLSVVVPVYRTPEELLRGALDSILASEGVTLELICVDDCPGCESSKVLEEYRDRDPRVVLLVNDRNRGVSYSRNRGLAAAHGEWLAFQDSDDTVLPDGYATLIAFAKEHNLDAARGLARLPQEPKEMTIYGIPAGEWRVASTTEGPEEALRSIVPWFSWTVWGGVCRRESVENLRFLERVARYEDSAFVAEMLLRPLRVGCLNRYFLTVYRHADSLSRVEPKPRSYVEYAIAARRIACLMERGKETIAPIILRFYAWRCLHILFNDRRGHDAPLTRRQRRAFCVAARDTCRVLHRHLPARLRLPLYLLITAPRLLFMPGNLLWNAIKWGMTR